MRLLPGPLRRWAEAPSGSRRGVIRGEVGSENPGWGSTSTNAWDELASDREVNPDLVGRARCAKLDEMSMSDPVVAGSLLSLKLPIGGATWKVKPRSADAIDQVVAAACERQLGLGEDGGLDSWLAGGFDALLWQSLLHLDYGSMTQEIVWRDKVESWVDADGDTHAMYVIERIAPRYPHTLEDYRGGTGPGEPLASVQQEGVRSRLPGGKLIHLVHQPHLSRFTGSSIVRPAYGIWKLKRKMIVSAAVGYDRMAAGTPVIRSPGTGSDEEERRARDMGRRHRNHEQAYFWLPGQKPGPGQAGWDVEILSGAATLADPIPQLRHYDEQMVSAVLGRFFMLGSTDTGSRAVGEVLAEPFYQALNWHADRLARELTQQLLARFVLANFGPTVRVPMLVVETIQQKNLPLRGDFIAKAKAAGVTFSDRGAQNTIRSWVDVEPLPEDYPLEVPGEGQGPLSPAKVPPPPPPADPLGTGPPHDSAKPPRTAPAAPVAG